MNMRKRLPAALVALLAAGALASCRMVGDPGKGNGGDIQGAGPGDDTGVVPDNGQDNGSGADIAECPYLKMEHTYNYTVTGIYEDRIPVDGRIVIPDGVALGDTWCYLYDESDEYLGRSLEASAVNSISLPAGDIWMRFDNITKLEGWNTGGWDFNNMDCIDIIYRGNLADWCEHVDLSRGTKFFLTVRSIKIGRQETDLADLRKITAEDIAGAERIGNYAFYKCSGLTSVDIPGSVTEIGDYAFYGCSGLTEVDIPDSVTEIGYYAFAFCSGLTTVTIGKGVTKIGSWAFGNCENLNSVTFDEPNGWLRIDSYGNETPAFSDDSFNNATILKENMAFPSWYYVRK